MSALDDLYEERFGRSLWWKAPEKTLAEEVGATLRRMLLKATQETDELEMARRDRGAA